jgi:hypothetical protein
MDHITAEGVIGRRYRLLRGVESLKADFVADPIARLSPPEDRDGVRVLGIDDLYLRKILIGASGPYASEPRIEGRDLLDIHALSVEHHALSRRLAAMRVPWRSLRVLQTWLDRFSTSAVGHVIRETRYRLERNPAAVLEHVREELRRAAAALIKERP